MHVHRVEPGEHVPEVVRPDRQHQGQADRRVERVTSAHPVPEFEHVGTVDTELGHLLRVRRDRHEVERNRVRAERVDQPGPRGAGIRERLQGGEGLRRHDEQRLGRVEIGCRFPDVGTIHIRYETELYRAVGVIL